MFTGLIKTQGTIRRIDQRGDCLMTIALAEPFPMEIGDSIACNGVCLTVIKINGNEFKVSLSAETIGCTTAKDWAVGTLLNLEPALQVGAHLGGHFVSGHVDGLAQVIATEKSGDSTIWEFSVPPTLAPFIAPKGSVTLDGVSLTVNDVKEAESKNRGMEELKDSAPVPRTSFTVNIIPHTAKVTGFGQLKIGDHVNLEIDMLARYVARLLEAKSNA